jgi:predicted negative regulator of RcsB-dependent stress response
VDDLSEKEQLDLMRAWWSENARYVIGGVVLGVAILFGWNQWRSGIAQAQLEASTMYEIVMTNVGDGDAVSAGAAALDLFSKHPDSEYASHARLAMARLYMDKGRDLDAANVLQDLIDADGDNETGLIGRLRLARVLLYQGKAEDVVALLADHRDNAFASRYNELLGDAYVELGSFAEAETAYNAAINDPQSSGSTSATLIQMKINDLPDPDDVAPAATTVISDPENNPDPIAAPAEEAVDAAEDMQDDSGGSEAPE